MNVVILNNASVSYVLQQNFCLWFCSFYVTCLIIKSSIFDWTMSVDWFNSFMSFASFYTAWKQQKTRNLTLSWRRPLSYRNQSIDLLCKLMDWFLYDNGLHHQRVNDVFRMYSRRPVARKGLATIVVWSWLELNLPFNIQYRRFQQFELDCCSSQLKIWQADHSYSFYASVNVCNEVVLSIVSQDMIHPINSLFLLIGWGYFTYFWEHI